MYMNVIEVPFDHKMFNEEFHGPIDNFIYDDFVLLFTKNEKVELGLHVFYQCENGDMSGTQIHLIKLFKDWVKNIYYDVELSDKIECGFNVFCNSDVFKYLNIGFDIAEITFRTICYIMNTPRNRIAKPSKRAKPENNNKSESQRDNKIYLLDDVVEYVNVNGLSNLSRTTHIINCPCWSVRGHYRHYKNGKVIFVKNYEKGKEKGKVEPKTKKYVL